MKRVTVSFLCGFVLGVFPIALNVPASPGKMDSLKANLDLPYDAGGVDEESEEAPGIVGLYGGVYEADAVVFCLDASDSMISKGRWGLQQREMTRAVSELNTRTKFNMVFYGSGAYAFRKSTLSADQDAKKQALSFLNSQKTTHGTCLGPGVLTALKMLQNLNAKHRVVIVAGDGEPTPCGKGVRRMTDEEKGQLIQETITANPGLQVRIHTIYVGQENDDDVKFMRQLAAAHNGTFRLVTR